MKSPIEDFDRWLIAENTLNEEQWREGKMRARSDGLPLFCESDYQQDAPPDWVVKGGSLYIYAYCNGGTRIPPNATEQR